MIVEPLEETYFKWLAAQVVNVRLRSPRLSYWNILRQLFVTEFIWTVRNDDNRAEDGKELRLRFLEEHSNEETRNGWLTQECSFLEMLIALSGRLAFQTDGVSPAKWFWHLMNNVDLHVTDEAYDDLSYAAFAEAVLANVNNRTYYHNGRGGLFPLNTSQIDQTRVELWDQMNYYLIERS